MRAQCKDSPYVCVCGAQFGGIRVLQMSVGGEAEADCSTRVLRAQEAEERLDDMEFKDTISLWSYNQARVEEEINRRQEALTMSSQVLSACSVFGLQPRGLLRPRPSPAFLEHLFGLKQDLAIGQKKFGPCLTVLQRGATHTFRAARECTSCPLCYSLVPHFRLGRRAIKTLESPLHLSPTKGWKWTPYVSLSCLEALSTPPPPPPHTQTYTWGSAQ